MQGHNDSQKGEKNVPRKSAVVREQLKNDSLNRDVYVSFSHDIYMGYHHYW